MNKDRRKALQEAVSKLDEARAALFEAKGLIETAKDEEQDYFDNMPEAFQQGDKGQAAEAAIAELDNAIESIDAAVDNTENAQG